MSSFRPIEGSPPSQPVSPVEAADTSPVHEPTDVKPESPPSPREEMITLTNETKDLLRELIPKLQAAKGDEVEVKLGSFFSAKSYKFSIARVNNQLVVVPKEWNKDYAELGFVPEEKIGEGSLGVVSKANALFVAKVGSETHAQMREVVVKGVSEGQYEDLTVTKEEVEFELTHTALKARVLSGAHAPHVNKEAVLISRDGRAHIVSIYRPGGTFSLTNGSVEERLEHLNQAWMGIEEEMEVGLFHLDHKPGNILVGGEKAWICDIGGDLYLPESLEEFRKNVEKYHLVDENKRIDVPFAPDYSTTKFGQVKKRLDCFMKNMSSEKEYHEIRQELIILMKQSHAIMQAEAILGSKTLVGVKCGFMDVVESVDVDVLRSALLEKYQGQEIDSICSTLQNLS